jgi:hypothetical protein
LKKIVPFVVGIGIFVTLFAVLFLDYSRRSGESIERANIEYPRLTLEEEFSGTVATIFCPPEVRCSTPPARVFPASGKKRSIYASKDVSNTTYLDDFLSVGDYLVKESGSDTLNVYRNNVLTVFVLDPERQKN